MSSPVGLDKNQLQSQWDADSDDLQLHQIESENGPARDTEKSNAFSGTATDDDPKARLLELSKQMNDPRAASVESLDYSPSWMEGHSDRDSVSSYSTQSSGSDEKAIHHRDLNQRASSSSAPAKSSEGSSSSWKEPLLASRAKPRPLQNVGSQPSTATLPPDRLAQFRANREAQMRRVNTYAQSGNESLDRESLKELFAQERSMVARAGEVSRETRGADGSPSHAGPKTFGDMGIPTSRMVGSKAVSHSLQNAKLKAQTSPPPEETGLSKIEAEDQKTVDYRGLIEQAGTAALTRRRGVDDDAPPPATGFKTFADMGIETTGLKK